MKTFDAEVICKICTYSCLRRLFLFPVKIFQVMQGSRQRSKLQWSFYLGLEKFFVGENETCLSLQIGNEMNGTCVILMISFELSTFITSLGFCRQSIFYARVFRIIAFKSLAVHIILNSLVFHQQLDDK